MYNLKDFITFIGKMNGNAVAVRGVPSTSIKYRTYMVTILEDGALDIVNDKVEVDYEKMSAGIIEYNMKDDTFRFRLFKPTDEEVNNDGNTK